MIANSPEIYDSAPLQFPIDTEITFKRIYIFYSHTTRACDTLRVILSNFLPIIQANIDHYAPTRALGVDIPREERQNKCLECRDWLLRIKTLPENRHMGSTLLQLQNLIVDI